MLIIYDTTGNYDNELGRCLCKACGDKEYRNVYGKVLIHVREELKICPSKVEMAEPSDNNGDRC